MYHSLQAAAVAALLCLPRLGQVTSLAPTAGKVFAGVDGWTSRNPKPRGYARYSPEQAATYQARRAAKWAKQGAERLRADFWNPTVTDQQMIDRYGDNSLLSPWAWVRR